MNQSSAELNDEIQLEPKQLRAATMLAAGCPAKDVAADLQVTPQTISAWRAQPAFRETLNGLKIQYLRSARDALRSLSMDATDELARLMRGGKSERVRLQAALAVLRGVGLMDHEYTKNVLWRRIGTT